MHRHQPLYFWLHGGAEAQVSQHGFIFIQRPNVCYSCVYVFGLVSPLFGLALSSADAFWESLQHFWQEKAVETIKLSMLLAATQRLERNVGALSTFNPNNILPWNISVYVHYT